MARPDHLIPGGVQDKEVVLFFKPQLGEKNVPLFPQLRVKVLDATDDGIVAQFEGGRTAVFSWSHIAGIQMLEPYKRSEARVW